MRKFEYKAVPAPTTGTKTKGVKTTEDRFALSLTDTLNDMAGEGWEYVRAETLPCDERKGLTGSQKTYQNILIFRRLTSAPLPLDDSPRVRSVPHSQVSLDRPVSEPVTPRRVVSGPPAENHAPPVGAARDD
ncbi:MAG: DUF4177 domain-containing protein [Silicimonas sp.]|nr:DUF4177 domain-containing protein [Silicimonas sp.]